jgi:hypothetical protein
MRATHFAIPYDFEELIPPNIPTTNHPKIKKAATGSRHNSFSSPSFNQLKD